MVFDGLVLCLKSSDVKRFHSELMLNQYTVGQHSFNMMVLANQLGFDFKSYPELYNAIFMHDMQEGLTGDMPSTAKKYFRENYDTDVGEEFERDIQERVFNQTCVKDIDNWKHLLDLFDLLELYIYLYKEEMMGNTLSTKICNRVRRKLELLLFNIKELDIKKYNNQITNIKDFINFVDACRESKTDLYSLADNFMDGI